MPIVPLSAQSSLAHSALAHSALSSVSPGSTTGRSLADFDLPKDPVAAPIQELITFFAAELKETRFPDVDAERLHELAAVVRARAQDVARARQVLEEVLGGLEEARTELEQKAQRALAYTRVFAEGSETLSRRVEQLELARPKSRRGDQNEPRGASAAAAAPKKRRKRTPAASLPLQGPERTEPTTPESAADHDEEASIAA